MVTKTLQTLSKAEKELERMTDNGEAPDQTEQAMKEIRHWAEEVTFSAARAGETWGGSRP